MKAPCGALVVAAVAAALAIGCDGPTTAYFAVPGGTPNDDFYALPFPNDLRRHDDGTLDLSLFPTNSVIANTVRMIAERDLDGFGLNAAMSSRLSGPLDASSLPTPAVSVTEAASVYLVDIDDSSPTRGQRTPVVATFHAEGTQTIDDNRLVVRPYPGWGLADATRYALVITNRVYDANGNSIERDSDFSALMSTTAATPAIVKAREVYAPLLAWLDEPGGDERGDVVSAAVFTTQHATTIGPALRKGVYGTPAPVARKVSLVSTSSAFSVFRGAYDAPNFQSGDVPYISTGGEITIGRTGAAIVTRTETLRFLLSVPAGNTPPTGFPICIYQHGTTGSWSSFLEDGTAERLAAEGIAVISTDQVLHGPRDPTGTDPSLSFFNFNNPVAGRDNPLQGAADAWSQQRLALGLSIPNAGRTITFDPERVMFFGHSQGGLTGPAYIAFEPKLKGAVLSGTAGLFTLGVLYKLKPVNFPDLISTLIRDEPLDEDNPTIALAQMAVERSDGINYARFMVREPQKAPDGSPLAPRNIFHTEGFVDNYSPNPGLEAFATALGGDLVDLPDAKLIEGLALRGRSIVSTPIAANDNGVTVVTAQYKQAGASDGHFVVFDVSAARKQSSKFLGSLAATGQATVVTP